MTQLLPGPTSKAAIPALVGRALAAAGGKEQLSKTFRIEEHYHFGDSPEPAEGQRRSTRTSVVREPEWGPSRKE